MEFIFQISGHPKVGEKIMPGLLTFRCSQKAGISGKAIKFFSYFNLNTLARLIFIIPKF
jgi:hypothetical protein